MRRMFGYFPEFFVEYYNVFLSVWVIEHWEIKLANVFSTFDDDDDSPFDFDKAIGQSIRKIKSIHSMRQKKTN